MKLLPAILALSLSTLAIIGPPIEFRKLNAFLTDPAAVDEAAIVAQAESDAAVAIAYAQLIELPHQVESLRNTPEPVPASSAEPEPDQTKEVIHNGHTYQFRRTADGWEYLDLDGVWQKHPGNDAQHQPSRRGRW